MTSDSGHSNIRHCLSTLAVEKHINSIFSKLGLTGDQRGHPRVRAVLLYLSYGRTPPDRPAPR